MTVEEIDNIDSWYCEKCPLFNGNNSEIYNEKTELFKTVKPIHVNHDGWKKGIPEKTLKDGVGGHDSKTSSDSIVDDFNRVNMSIDLEQIIKKSYGFTEKCKNVLLYLIKEKQIIAKSKQSEVMFTELKKYDVEFSSKELNDSIYHISQSQEVFTEIKNTSYELGTLGKSILLDKKQNTEVAYWILGRYSIKRIDLTGDLLFFNDQYLQNNAEVLIRRSARECLINSTSGDMNEIVKYVEDKAKIITFEDIENHAHLKCFLNGTYNIKTGEFVKEFSKDNIILQQIPHNYNESEKYEEIDKIVTQIISNKIDKQMFYDSISLCFHPYNGINHQYGGVGMAGTGKNQLVDLVTLSLGSKNCSNAPIHLLARDLTIQKECAYLMCNVDPDLSDENIEHLDTIKKWVTQDPFTGRGIYGHTTTFRPMSRLMFMANELFELPSSKDADAIYDRTYLSKLDNRFRHTDKEKKNIMRQTATNKELDGFVTYLLKNATWINKHQSTHYPLKPLETKNIWNIFGNRIKNFFDKLFTVNASMKTPKQMIYDKWLHYALENNFPVNEKKKFFELFDEIVGTAPMNTRMNGEQVFAYSGFGLKSDDLLKEEAQIKIKRIAYKCNSCSVVYNTNEPLEKLRQFHREFFPHHLIIEDITKNN